MNITQAIKDDLIHSMIRHASKRQASSTTKAAKALNKLWRQLFAKHIQQVIPEVPQERWADLIQEGVFNSMKGDIQMVTLRESDNSTLHTPLGRVTISYSTSTKLREADAKKWHAVRKAVSAEWGGFLNFTVLYVGSYDVSYYWKCSHPDLPSVKGLDRVFHPDVLDKFINDPRLPYSDSAFHLSKDVSRLMNAFMDVIKAGGDMFDDLTTILTSVRTLKQLEDQFPEAVQFLPQEFTKKVRNTKQVADPALVNRAKEMLLTGIPN